MAINAQGVFDLTMAIIDEVSDNGKTDTADTAEYKNRTLHILNVLQGELYPFSDAYTKAEPGKRAIAEPIINFTAAINSLDDYICTSVLPYGLAAHLLIDENPSSASFFQQRYDELKMYLSRGIAAVSEDITDLYGGIEYGEFSRW